MISWWRGHEPAAGIFTGIGLFLLLLGALVPTRLGLLQRAWMSLAHAISKVTTPLFMGAVYFLVLTPTGLVMRLLGRRPLEHKPAADSYWIPRGRQGTGISDMNRQF